MKTIITYFLTALALLNLNAVASDELKQAALKTYADIAMHSSADAHAQAVALQEALKAFTAAPSEDLQAKAKQAWVAVRLPYLQSEIFRVGDDSLAALDAAPVEGEKAGGFKSIELLLWGEDESLDGAGTRSYEDFIKEKNAEAPAQAEYLHASAAMITEKLAGFAKDWKAGVDGNARAKFSAMPVSDGLKKIAGDIATLSGKTLAVERVGKAYESRDQKDESSNYSDMTHLDLAYDCSGMANLVAGAYVGIDKEVKVRGTGLLQLAAALDAAQGEKLKLAINRVMLAVTDFRPPFDRALMAPDDSPAREALKEIIDALGELSVQAQALGGLLGGTE